MKLMLTLSVFYLLFLAGCDKPAHHPLQVSEINPRYFTKGDGKVIYLAGSHTWNNLVDMTNDDSLQIFDYPAYLDFLTKYHHNFFRLWNWELLNWDTHANRDENAKDYAVSPFPWSRTGPGNATDGKPAFDLTRFNPEYFSRLRQRVQMAGDKDIYVAVMLFEGWGLQFSPDAYKNHPFYPENNINDLGLDTAVNKRLEIHELKNKKVLEVQENYVRKVLETVNDLDNVLFEISNENHPASTEWQYHMIRFIKDYEKESGNQHPVGMTFQYRGGTNQALFNSPADWISPNPEGGYRDDPPAADGSRVIVADTDHLWGLGGNPDWIWKSFTRGMNVLFMDPYQRTVLTISKSDEWLDTMRRNLGYTLDYAQKMDLAHMLPSGNLCSSGYCLANKGKEYLIYNPKDSAVNVDLSDADGAFKVEWFNPSNGETTATDNSNGGTFTSFNPPFHSDFSILYLKHE